MFGPKLKVLTKPLSEWTNEAHDLIWNRYSSRAGSNIESPASFAFYISGKVAINPQQQKWRTIIMQSRCETLDGYHSNPMMCEPSMILTTTNMHQFTRLWHPRKTCVADLMAHGSRGGSWSFSCQFSQQHFMLAIVGILLGFQDRPISAWPYARFSLNSVIALLATGARTSLMFAVTASIGQRKWCWFLPK
jgi:hypothetical protein